MIKERGVHMDAGLEFCMRYLQDHGFEQVIDLRVRGAVRAERRWATDAPALAARWCGTWMLSRGNEAEEKRRCDAKL